MDITKEGGKPTPSGVGWIAHTQYIKQMQVIHMCMYNLTTYAKYDILYIWRTIVEKPKQQYH